MNPIRTIVVAAAVAFFAVGAVAFSRAAGIECGADGDGVEAAICAEPALAKLDFRMVDSYRAARRRTDRKLDLLFAQRRFLEERAACARIDCIHELTIDRIAKLETWK